MSILDDIQARVSGLFEGHGDTVAKGQEKVGELGEQIKGAAQKVKDALGGNDGGAS